MIALDLNIPAIREEEFAELVRPKVDAAWEVAVAMTAAEIVERGHVINEGAPALCVIATWQIGPNGPLDVTGLDIAFAENEDDDRINAHLWVSRPADEARDCLVADVISVLHLHAIRQMNAPRPLEKLSGRELVDLAQQWRSASFSQDMSEEDEIRGNLAVERLAEEEIQRRKHAAICSGFEETESTDPYADLLQALGIQSRAARELDPGVLSVDKLDAWIDSIGLNIPVFPTNLAEIIRTRVEQAWDVAVQMTVSEIARRGCVDFYGEPGIGYVLTWTDRHGEPRSDNEAALDVVDLTITFVETDDPALTASYICPFRKRSVGVDRLVYQLIFCLYIQELGRMNPRRPLAGLEDLEVDALAVGLEFDDPNPSDIGPQTLKRNAVYQMAYLERFDFRRDKSAHVWIHRASTGQSQLASRLS